MSISKTVIKLNHIEAIVKVVCNVISGGTQTITLNSDILKSNEDLVGSPVVNLGSIECSIQVGSEANITRNNQVIMTMFENTKQFDLPWTADTQNNTSDIVVNFTGKGTVYIRLLKLKGYLPKFRPEQGIDPL
jgi:hypothetical protein